MQVFVSAVGFGFVTAALLAICAVGFTLQFSVTNVLNLAFGSVMTGSGFVAYGLNVSGMNIWLAMIIAALCGGVISVLMNALLYGPFIRHGMTLFGMVIVTISTAVISDHVIEAAVGPSFFSYNAPAGRALHFADFLLTRQDLTVIGIAVAVTLVTQLTLQRTRLGKSMRGLSVNASLARACGIPTRRIVNLAWFASGVMAGLGGVALFLESSTFSATTGSDFLIVIKNEYSLRHRGSQFLVSVSWALAMPEAYNHDQGPVSRESLGRVFRESGPDACLRLGIDRPA